MNRGTESMPADAGTTGHGLEIASLVLGILGVCFSLFVVGAVLGVAGLTLGLAHILRNRGNKAMPGWGLVLSLLSVVGGTIVGFA